MSNNNKAIMSSEDKRLQATTEALQNMKTIKEISILNFLLFLSKKVLETFIKVRLKNHLFKMLNNLQLNCWESLFIERINIHRKKELQLLAKDSFFWSVMTFFASISTLLVTTVTIGECGYEFIYMSRFSIIRSD